MAASSSTAGIALLLVSVLGIAAVGGVISYDYHDMDNPNGILGVYTVAEYTQGGIGPDGQWHWYETGDGMYDGETIIIEEYKNGFIKGYAYLNNEKYLLNGYYNPETCDFGYTSYYNYTPEAGDDVVDILYGSVKDNVMILTGYTVSTKTATQAFAFNFIFVKGGVPYHNPFHDTDFGTVSTNTMKVLDAKNATETEVTDTQTYKELEYRNGVYKLEINGELAAAVTTMNEVNGNIVMGTLRCVHLEDGHLCTEWIVVTTSGPATTKLYAFVCDSWDSSKTGFISIDRALGDLTPFAMTKTATFLSKSSLESEACNYQHSFVFENNKFFNGTHSIIVKNNTTGNNFIINVWAGVQQMPMKHVSSMFHTTLGGVEYYGELFGNMVGQKFTMTGFLISTTGETLVVNTAF